MGVRVLVFYIREKVLKCVGCPTKKPTLHVVKLMAGISYVIDALYMINKKRKFHYSSL